MDRASAWTVLIGAVYIGIVFMLVRPSSAGPDLVNSVADALSNLVKGTTGYGQFQ